jgi:hypothetical protein
MAQTGLDQYHKHSFFVQLGSDRSIVGPGRNRLLGTEPLERGSLRNYPIVSLQSGTGTARTPALELFVYRGPVRT